MTGKEPEKFKIIFDELVKKNEPVIFRILLGNGFDISFSSNIAPKTTL
jgi:hypothetical protein